MWNGFVVEEAALWSACLREPSERVLEIAPWSYYLMAVLLGWGPPLDRKQVLGSRRRRGGEDTQEKGEK